VIAFLQTGTNKGRLKQTGRLFLLIAEPIRDMKEMFDFLKLMHSQVVQTD